MPYIVAICTKPERVEERLDVYRRRRSRNSLYMGNPIDFCLMCGYHELNQLLYKTKEKIRSIEPQD